MVPAGTGPTCIKSSIEVTTVTLQFNINDGGATGDSAIRRAHERLLRKLLAYQHQPAVLEMVFYRYPDDPE